MRKVLRLDLALKAMVRGQAKRNRWGTWNVFRESAWYLFPTRNSIPPDEWIILIHMQAFARLRNIGGRKAIKGIKRV